ncbi:Pentatricopeptide repeat-containing protein At2g20710, mitochondrial [Linum grandiflorum]
MNQLSRGGRHQLRQAISKLLRVTSFSSYSRSRTSPPAFTSAPPDSLYNRVWRAGHPSISIVEVIEKWLDEGKQIKQSELDSLIRNLRRHRRHPQALQLSEWMRDQSCYSDSPGEIAVRLDLILKVRGLEQAEEAFEAVPEASRGFQVYGALLNCYARKMLVEKAEATMAKMGELKFLKSSLPYNLMLTLYYHTKNHEKLDALVKEMEEKGVASDIYTYNIRLNAYGASSRIQEMEELLNKLEGDTLNKVDWHSYFVVANSYLRAGEKDKAKTMMKKLEGLTTYNSRKFCYEVLISLYANAGEMDQVYRIWDLYKSMGKMFNSGYLCMISSLVKLENLEGAEKVWEEWLSKKTFHDIRILNQMVIGFARKGLWEKAEECVKKVSDGGGKPDPITWSCLSVGYHVGGEIEKAVETVKRAVWERESKPSGHMLKPEIRTVAACIEYLKGEGKVEEAEEILEKIRENCHFPATALNKLVAYLKDEGRNETPIDEKDVDGLILDNEETPELWRSSATVAASD